MQTTMTCPKMKRKEGGEKAYLTRKEKQGKRRRGEEQDEVEEVRREVERPRRRR